MAPTGGVLARLRQPAYTGENRCGPCTVVNVALATLASLQVALWATVARGPAVGAAVGGGLYALALAVVWLRGYLVPGTPALAPRLPDSFLVLLGKRPAPAVAQGFYGRAEPIGGDGDSRTDGRVASVLGNAGVVETDGNRRVDGLTDEFRTAWDAQVANGAAVRESTTRADGSTATATDVTTRIGEYFAVDGEAVTVRDRDGDGSGSGTVVARVGAGVVGAWPSRLALSADLAAARVLDDRLPEWDDLSTGERGRYCATLRELRDTCPACGDPLADGVVTVETCCTAEEAVAGDCVGCGTRLFEFPVDDGTTTPDGERNRPDGETTTREREAAG